MAETFEFEFTIGKLGDKMVTKIYPEKDNNGLYSSGRYVCEEKQEQYLYNLGEWKGEADDTIHFSDKNKALKHALWTIQRVIEEQSGLEDLQNQRNKLNRQISTLKKATLNKKHMCPNCNISPASYNEFEDTYGLCEGCQNEETRDRAIENSYEPPSN